MAKKARKRKYSKSSRGTRSEMRRNKKRRAKTGKGGNGGTVKSKEQAIAIGLSRAGKNGKVLPNKEIAFDECSRTA
jgi:Family of unknown function (DUF6496)